LAKNSVFFYIIRVCGEIALGLKFSVEYVLKQARETESCTNKLEKCDDLRNSSLPLSSFLPFSFCFHPFSPRPFFGALL